MRQPFVVASAGGGSDVASTSSPGPTTSQSEPAGTPPPCEGNTIVRGSRASHAGYRYVLLVTASATVASDGTTSARKRKASASPAPLPAWTNQRFARSPERLPGNNARPAGRGTKYATATPT